MVVNKQDCVDFVQRQEVLDHLTSQFAGIFDGTPPALFSVSAQQALAARLHGDAAALAASGLPAFEAALLNFLVNERRREFLLNMCGRIAAVLDSQGGADKDLARLAALRAEIEAVRPAEVTADLVAPPDAAISPTLPACEICDHVGQALFDFMVKYQHQLRGNRDMQADLANRGGLCGPHTWQFEAIAAPHEICTGFAVVVERQAEHLRSLARKAENGTLTCQAVEVALPTAETCVVCKVARYAATSAIERAAERLAHDTAGALRNLSAICLPHLTALVTSLGRSELVQKVLLREADLLDRLSEDMQHFALKRDGLRRYLTTKEEMAAGERSLRMLVGHPRAQMGSAVPPP